MAENRYDVFVSYTLKGRGEVAVRSTVVPDIVIVLPALALTPVVHL